MSVIRLCLLVIFVTTSVPAGIAQRATDEEARQVQEVSDTFEKRMRETRDVGSLKDLFLDDFMRIQIAAEKDSNPGHPISLIESIPLSLETNLATQVTRKEWERFYAARLNFRYYFVLLLVSRVKFNELDNPKGLTIDKVYPGDVLTLLRANPFLKGDYGVEHDHDKHQIKTLEEFLSVTNTLEQATLMLRPHLLKDPPEQTRIYQDNLRQAPRNTELTWPSVYGTEESRLGFPKGTRFFRRLTADSMFELWLVKTDAGMKIVWARVYPFN